MSVPGGREDVPGADEVTVGDVADAYVESFAALHPVAATQLGIGGHDTELTDFGPEGVTARAELARRARRAVVGARRTGPGDEVAAAVMVERLTASLDVHDSGEWRRDLNVLSSPLQQLRECFDLMPTDIADDRAAVLARMVEVPRALATIQASLHEGVAAGTPAARRQALACAAQARALAGQVPGVPGYFTRLAGATGAGGDDGLRAQLHAAAVRADAAFGDLAAYLDTEYAAVAGEEDGVGRERYSLLARTWNGVDLDLEDAYRWGWDELRRIEGDMERVAARVLPGQPLAAVRELLETDPARAVEGEDRLRAWLQDLMDAAIDDLNGVHFNLPVPVCRLEARIAPPGGAAAPYYTGPSEDFARPGRTWYPTQGRTRFPLWREVSTAYHEGVPGHHLQIAMTQYLKDTLNRFQRTMAFTAGHGEGWALYGERLMGELGYLENPDHELGMLSGHAMRAARVVVDIGLHLGMDVPADERLFPGERWTPELAAALLVERASLPAAFVASEVDRYLGMPGQAISYKVGERVWLAGREDARRRAGAAFDLKAFHARALGLGPMGLADLERLLGTS